MKQQTITIPDNMELVKVSETEYKIVEKKKELPESWDEFCETHPIKAGECWVSGYSEIREIAKGHNGERNYKCNNLLPNKEYAKAILALCQLIQLRDCYRQGWRPNWHNDDVTKYTIEFHNGTSFQRGMKWTFQTILSFQTEELRNEFYDNFGDLIEKIKPLFM